MKYTREQIGAMARRLLDAKKNKPSNYLLFLKLTQHRTGHSTAFIEAKIIIYAQL